MSSEHSEQDEHEARTRINQRRSRELEEDSARLRDHMLTTAESVRRSHERVADVMERLADAGAAEHAPRRRQLAERSREFADDEARQIAGMKNRKSGERDEASRGDDPQR